MKHKKALLATGAAVAILTVGAVGAGVAASGSIHVTATRHSTAPTPAAPTTPALSGSQAQWVSDARAQFGFDGDSDQAVLGLGQNACAARQSGSTQAQAVTLIDSETSGGSNEPVVRLAEKDLCPAQVPVPHWHVLASYSGSSNWNSPPFKLHNGSHLKVMFFYSGNATYGSADNFIADLVSSADDLSMANDISAAGGQAISLYPDLSFGGSKWYHLEVEASGNWSFRIKQKW